MKTRSSLLIAALSTFAAASLAQEGKPFTPPPGGGPDQATPPSTPQPQPQEQRSATPPSSPGEERRPKAPQPYEEERGPRHHEDREGRREPAMQNRPFLGVVTQPVPDSLRAQTNLPEGFGLVVEDVLPDSPAAKAGLQRFDILKLLNDQQLVNPDQLATLVRAAGKGKEVTLTVIHQGQEQKLPVTIGEHQVPQRRSGGPEDWFHQMPGMPRPDGRFGGNMDEWREHMQQWGRENRDRGERWGKDAQERAERARKEMERRMQEHKGSANAGPELQPEDILRESQPGTGGQLHVITRSGVTTVNGAKARVVLRDNDGEIEVADDNGKRTLTAKSPDGKVVFNGPVDTDEQRKAVPEVFRKKLDMLKNIQVRTESGNSGASASAGAENPSSGSPDSQ